MIQLPLWSKNPPLWVPWWALLPAMGLPFALLLTSAMLLWARTHGGRAVRTWRFMFGGAILAIGMPLAIVIALFSVRAAVIIAPPGGLNYGGVSPVGVAVELVACGVWSIAIFLWARFINKPAAARILWVALASTCAIVLAASLVDILCASHWHRSLPFSLLTVTEEISSALVLASAAPTGAPAPPDHAAAGARTQ